MKAEMSIEINRPPEAVFHAVENDICEWSLTCVEDTPILETPERVGSTFHLVTEERGRRMTFEGVVTEHDPPRVTACHLTGQHFDIDVHYTFEKTDGGTRLTHRSEVTGKGFARVMFALLGWAMRRSGCDALRRELESLKAFCESRP